MKKSLLIGIVCFACTGMVSATVVNDIGPTWRGDYGTTYQAWTFDNGNNPVDIESDLALDSNYDILTLLITIEPSPDLETIELRPKDCTMYIDQVVVDARAIPEPATMGLLVLGGLLLRRKTK